MKVDVSRHLLPIELVKSMIPSPLHNGSMFQRKYNPADKATCGLTAKELVNDKEWLFGPFLYEDPSKWLERHFEDSKEAQEEEKVVQKPFATSAVKPLINVLSFSKWLKLIHTVAWILRFPENICRRETDRQMRELEPQELQKAERIIICVAQEECFPDELKSLRNGHGIPSRTSVKSLYIYINILIILY